MSLPYSPTPNAEIDGHLNLLATFHYVLGGLMGLFACFPLIHVGVGVAIVTDAFPTGNGQALPHAAGWGIIAFASMFILMGWVIAVMMLVAGRKLQRRRSHMFCMVVAGIECLFMPLGTILGVFTLVVLTKDAAKARFAAGEMGM